MSSDTTLTDSDEGKKVVSQDGDTVGRVVEVGEDGAYVDPDPSVTDSIMSNLGWGESDEETYLLDENAIGEVTDDEVRLGAL